MVRAMGRGGEKHGPAALCQEAFVLGQLGNLTAKPLSGGERVGSPPQHIGAALLSVDGRVREVSCCPARRKAQVTFA